VHQTEACGSGPALKEQTTNGPWGGCHHDLIGSNRSRFLVSLVGCKIRSSSLSITKQQVVV
jgi:hypothetical protein